MITYLIAMAIVFGVLTLWVLVQQWSQRFALRHPQNCPAPEVHECHRCALSVLCGQQEAPDDGAATMNVSGEAK